jgi:hypothetical protein
MKVEVGSMRTVSLTPLAAERLVAGELEAKGLELHIIVACYQNPLPISQLMIKVTRSAPDLRFMQPRTFAIAVANLGANGLVTYA